MANAKEIAVAYHKWHVVSGPVGGKVCNEDGTVTYCTIPEGGQGCFYAVSTKVYTEDAAVQVDEIVNFNGALVASAGSGSGGGACLVTKDANGNYLLGEGAQAAGNGYFSTVLGQSSAVNGSESVTVGYMAETESYGVSVGAEASATYTGGVAIGCRPATMGAFGISVGMEASGYDRGVAVGYKSHGNMYAVAVGSEARTAITSVAIGANAYAPAGHGSMALGYKASAMEIHTSAIGSEAKAGYIYSMAIGEKTSTYEAHSLILAARSSESGCALTFELLAKEMAATGEDGAIGDVDAFITGGSVRFGVHDLVSGERETMTISVELLWAMLRAAGGVSEKSQVSGEYY